MNEKKSIDFDLGNVNDFKSLYGPNGELDPMTTAIILGCFLAGIPIISQMNAGQIFRRLRMMEHCNGPLCVVNVKVDDGNGGKVEKTAYRDLVLVDVFRHVGLTVKTPPKDGKQFTKLLVGYLDRRTEKELHEQGKALVLAAKTIPFPKPAVEHAADGIEVIDDASPEPSPQAVEAFAAGVGKSPSEVEGDLAALAEKPPEVVQEVGKALLESNAAQNRCGCGNEIGEGEGHCVECERAHARNREDHE